jgi:uncharacterized SAM-dependent methyltransferase
VQAITQSAPDARHFQLLAELRDGLARAQPEIPSKYLADPGVQMLRSPVGELFAAHDELERALLATIGDDHRRVRLCLGNAIGAVPTVGAVRMLRTMRADMRAPDRLVIGVDLRGALTELEQLLDDRDGVCAAHHYGVLDMLNARYDADFDRQHLEYRVARRPGVNRVETRLKVRKAHDIRIDGVSAASFAKNDFISMSVRCTFTRSSLETLLNCVGLEVERWVADDAERYAIGVAVPLRREP